MVIPDETVGFVRAQRALRVDASLTQRKIAVQVWCHYAMGPFNFPRQQ
jgi:hypothetical protein